MSEQRAGQLSPDGFWWWDGTRWVSAISPDGRWRWDGERWVVNEVAARPLGPVRYERTRDTRRVQAAVVGYLLLSVVHSAAVLPTTFRASMESALRNTPGLDPSTFDAMMTGLIVFAIAVAAIWAGVLIFGTWSLWRWVYYVVMILGALSAFSVLTNGLALGGAGSSALLPAWTSATGLVVSLLYVALAVWMFTLWRRYQSAWARRALPA